MATVIGTIIGILIIFKCMGSIANSMESMKKTENEKKYGTRYPCGQVIDGIFKGYSLVTYQPLTTVFLAQGKADLQQFPFQDIKKYEVVSVDSSGRRATGNDKIYVEITWESGKSSLVIFDKMGKDRLVRNVYKNKERKEK